MLLPTFKFERFMSAAAGFVAILFIASHADAALILHVNTASETMSLTGSDSGSPSLDSVWKAEWLFSGASGSAGPDFLYFSPSYSGNTPFLSRMVSFAGPGGGDVTLTLLDFPDGSGFSVTGSGSPVDYSGIDAGSKTLLESMIGSSMSPTLGSGLSPITVVPEPSTGLLMGMGLGLWGVVARLKDKPRLRP